MFTTCPHCALNLAVTAADLRLGQGYVRCGRCISVFNALLSLSDEGDAAADEEAVEQAGAAEPPSVAQVPTPAMTQSPGAAAAAAPADEPHPGATGTFETIVLEGDAILQTEEVVEESEVDAQLQALVQRFDAVRDSEDTGAFAAYQESEREAAAEAERAEDAVLNASFLPEDGIPASDPQGTTDTEAWSRFAEREPDDYQAVQDRGGFDSQDDAAGERGARRRPWLIAAAAVLALLLLIQVVHHYRLRIATLPWAAAVLTPVYGVFGAKLTPQWDLTAYDVRQLGAEAVSGDATRIAVRASVRNGAKQAQPAPLLRVVLQDRFGNALSTTQVAPQDYLLGQAQPMLQPDQRVDAQLQLPDPTQAAVGFEIDACLPGEGATVRCASDSPAR